MRALILLLGTAALVGTLPEVGSGAEDVPKGTFRSTYFADRWGQHHFAGRFVDPKLRDKFEPFAGRPAVADVTKNYQPENPGGAVILEVGKIEAAEKDVPLALELAWKEPPRGATASYRRAEPNDRITLIAKVTNRTDRPIRVGGKGIGEVTLRLFSQLEVSDGVTRVGHTRGVCAEHKYTKRVWVHRGAFERLALEDERVRFDEKDDRKDDREPFGKVELAAGKSHSWEVSFDAPAATEYELWLAYAYWLQDWTNDAVVLSKPVRLDVLAARPGPDGPVSVALKLGAVPPKPTRPVPAEVTFTNSGKDTISFQLPLRGENPDVTHAVCCYDGAGNLLRAEKVGPNADWNLGYAFRTITLKPGESKSVPVELPSETGVARVVYPSNIEKDGKRVDHGPGHWYLFSPHVVVR